MDCQQATTLISGRIDREIPSGDRHALETHLGECDGCRATVEAFERQDRNLRRLFTPCEASAALVVERVLGQLRVLPAPAIEGLPRAEGRRQRRRRQRQAWALAVA